MPDPVILGFLAEQQQQILNELAAMLRRFAADQARDAARDYARTATAAA